MPILLQQAIDRGITGGVNVGLVATLAAIAGVALAIAGIAQRQAVVRLGQRSEQALYELRTRLISHIHRISLADHNEERRGALVARVTSDIETLAQFFQWGGLAWLLDGPLMLMVAAVMLAYDWILALVAFAVAAPLALGAPRRAAAPRHRPTSRPASATARCSPRSPRSSRARRRSGPTTPGRRWRPMPTR